jgi:hypothetical protein
VGKCEAPIANEISNTPGYGEGSGKPTKEFLAKVQYKWLQTATKTDGVHIGNAFNPYWQLLHANTPDNPFLGIDSIYAYSIDDDAGVFEFFSKGEIIAVGGTAGLPNQNPLYRGDNVNVIAPGFIAYGVCQYRVGKTCPTDQSVDGPSQNFNLKSIPFDTQVVLAAPNNKTYQFVLKKGSTPFPTTPSKIMIECVPGDPNIGFCQRDVSGYSVKANMPPANPNDFPLNYLSTNPAP